MQCTFCLELMHFFFFFCRVSKPKIHVRFFLSRFHFSSVLGSATMTVLVYFLPPRKQKSASFQSLRCSLAMIEQLFPRGGVQQRIKSHAEVIKSTQICKKTSSDFKMTPKCKLNRNYDYWLMGVRSEAWRLWLKLR